MDESQRTTFTLRNMLVAVAAIGLLMAIVAPIFQRARINSRQDACVSNIRQLVLALHLYHDIYKRFPHLTSTSIRGIAPGSSAAGYGWCVATLPYLEEATLYTSIERDSRSFSLSPFDGSLMQTSTAGSRPHAYAAANLSLTQCPSSSGGDYASAPEYTALGLRKVGTCSYVTLPATHLDCLLGDENAADYIPPNGAIVPGPQIVSLRDIVDGSSKTFIMTETREQNYTSWYDGTVAWVVPTVPGQPNPTLDVFGRLTMGPDQLTSLNFGPSPNMKSIYLPAKVHGSIAADWNGARAADTLVG